MKLTKNVKKIHFKNGVEFFDKKCVMPELYESIWCVIGDTKCVTQNSVRFVYVDTPGSSFSRKIKTS